MSYQLLKTKWSHRFLSYVTLLVLVSLLAGCGGLAADIGDLSSRPIRVVATTGMVTDIVKFVGGERVQVRGLMGPGIHPHTYKATEGNVIDLAGADLVFYSGLHLEAKLVDVFEKLAWSGTIRHDRHSPTGPARVRWARAESGEKSWITV